jgi:hypothetical protein
LELRDFIVTPIVILLVYAGAYLVRPYVTDAVNRKYFLPALTLKIIGALAVGFVYQFYYSGGDTFNFHTYGSRHIWDAVFEDPEKGLRLLFTDGTGNGLYKYTSRIIFFSDPSSYAIIRLAAFLDLITFSSYSGTAVLFAVFGFSGLWMLYLTFYKLYPLLHRQESIAILFVPSVIFWGSGLLKDTITLSLVGMATYATFSIFMEKRFKFGLAFLLFVSLYGLYSIKIYILLTFLPSAIAWIFFVHFGGLRSQIAKLMLFPFTVIATVALAYFALQKASEDNPKYALDKISKTAQITSYDIRFWSGRAAGSGYTLGDLDGSWQSMVKLLPQAINVSLFRPYLWEVRNPLMLLSSLESLAFFFLTLFTVYKTRLYFLRALSDPTILFCFIFSLTFAFAVGVSTFNFGTLMRYKIPLVPFYLLALILTINYAKRERNKAELVVME